MKKTQKMLSLLLAIVLCVSLLPLSALAVEDVTDVENEAITDVAEAPVPDADEAPVTDGETYSGACGENVTWTLDTETGALTISGKGAMKNYEWSTSAPWYSYRTSIKTATVQSGVTTIGDWAFNDCASLTSVTIPGSVTTIGSWAFNRCTNLTSVTIPDGVTSIGDLAFASCASLTSVTIPDSVTSIGGDAFSGCTSLTSVTIPDGVTTIGNFAFSNCTSLTSVTIPDGVASIGDCAFANCTSLTSVTFPDSVTSIDFGAFSGCTSLTSVTIGNGVTSIGEGAFWGCTSLTRVTIPDSVTSIGGSAFESCTSLTEVYYAGSEADWAAITIDKYNEPLTNATIHFNAATPSSSPFTDVPDTVSYYKYVMWAYNNGIVKGTSATTFSPNADCTRGQFALMLYRLAGKPDVTGVENPFKDVKKSDSYYKAILWAYNAGIIKGTSATTFNPSGSVTRGQIVLMQYRMAGKPTVTNTTNPFTDVKKTDACYKAVLWAVEQGITKGTSATTFSPNKNCTRYQLVTFLYRFNDLMQYI